RGRTTVQDRIEVMAGLRRKACIEIIRNARGGQDRHPITGHLQMRVECALNLFDGVVAGQIEMRDLCRSMHPCVGAASAPDRHAFTAESEDRLLYRTLDRRQIRLALPAGIALAVIFDVDTVAGHWLGPAFRGIDLP